MRSILKIKYKHMMCLSGRFVNERKFMASTDEISHGSTRCRDDAGGASR
jgi:hypothetical protein